jgi:hypothetical protein
MEQDARTIDDGLEVDDAVIDDAYIADFCRVSKLTPDHRKFCELLAQGHRQTHAFRMAWPNKFTDDDRRLRSEASKLAHRKKVQRLVALLKGQRPDETPIGDLTEALRILWDQARCGDATISQRAIAQIEKIETSIAERKRAEAQIFDKEPREILDEMCRGPFGPVFALAMAASAKMPYALPPGIEIDFDALLAPTRWAAGTEHPVTGRRDIDPDPPAPQPSTPGERARRKFLQSIDGDPFRGGPTSEGQARGSSDLVLPTVPRAVGPTEAPDSWLREGGHPADVAGALTRETAMRAVAALNRRRD